MRPMVPITVSQILGMLTSMHLLTDSVYGGYTENLVVEDVDGDGLDEVIFAFNGGSNPTSGYSTYSEDRFFVVGVQGDIGVLPKAVEEFVIAPRDRNKDGVRGNDMVAVVQ